MDAGACHKARMLATPRRGEPRFYGGAIFTLYFRLWPFYDSKQKYMTDRYQRGAYIDPYKNH
jgi:hypothetical protein